MAGDKRPTTRWRDEATADPDRIAAWWQANPDANIGIACGVGSGLVVVDIDDLEALQGLRARGPLPETLTARTPRGGLHLYYRHPGGQVPNTAGLLAPKVDTRGDGGYVVAPPSTLPNGRYTWMVERDLAPLPQWIVEASRRTHNPVADDTFAGTPQGELGDRWGATVLERELAGLVAAGEGVRNDTLYHATLKVAGASKGGHVDEGAARRQLEQVAVRIGLDPSEVAATIESAWQVADERHPEERAVLPPVATGVPPAPAPQPAPSGGPASMLSLDDLDALPPVEWLIPNMLPRGLNMLWGEYGAGKSFLAIDWSMSLACGAVDGTQRTVVYALGEGVEGFRDRLTAWMAHHPTQPRPAGRFFVRSGSAFPMVLEPTSIAALCSDIEAMAEPPDLLVIDTLARSLADEEGAQQFGRAVRVADELYNRYGTSVLYVHHAGVNRERERGHTALGASCESVWSLAMPDFEGHGAYHRLENRKQKNGPRHKPITLKMNALHGSALLMPTTPSRMRP